MVQVGVIKNSLIIIFIFCFFSCKKEKKSEKTQVSNEEVIKINVPNFNSDSISWVLGLLNEVSFVSGFSLKGGENSQNV